MRSYYAHLQTTNPDAGGIPSRPIYRSSAIFPVFQNKNISTRLLFLGYWQLKRHIREISAIITLRSDQGEILDRVLMTITEAKAYSVELTDLLLERSLSLEFFEGSLEIEFFSTENMFFAYPAVVINYYGPAFSTVVHSAQRIYNDFEDMQKNSLVNVPESGFNIHANENNEPFIGLINGTEIQREGQIEFKFYNHDGELLEYVKPLGTLKPYQSTILYPARELDLKTFLGGHEGACKARFNVKGIFPRLLVGNYQKNPEALSITHSYYDCSSASSSSDYWRASEPGWYMASLMLPLALEKDYFTNIYFYPIYSPSSLVLDIEIYSSEGKLLGAKQHALQIDSPKEGFSVIPLRKIAEELRIPPQQFLGARIIASPLEGSPFPSRLKIGLDIGQNSFGLPCNICMNLQPFNPPLENKRSSFKWLPILGDQPKSSIWIMNSSPSKSFQTKASLDITFFREKDALTLSRHIEILPHGFLIIAPHLDPQLDAFLGETVGWATIVSNNPYLTTYYFADHPTSGVVGGDHGF